MALYRDIFGTLEHELFLTYTGIETDLIFTKGIDLPGFAAFPLLETEEGREILGTYYRYLIELARVKSTAVILESPTWMANRDRAAAIGYSPEDVVRANRDAIAHMAKIRAKENGVTIVLSANIGPRDDAYAPSDQMSAETAEAYHSEQMAVLASTEVDIASGYTLAYPAEAIGMAHAARKHGLPLVVAFKVEIDGYLPNGEALQSAVEAVDAATDNYPTYFMINCAHPDHFENVLTDAPWAKRVKGIVANASRCSHVELDEAEELDDGNPQELGSQLAALKDAHSQLRVLGGCCGTDLRHLAEIAARTF
ncbi:MAG: homocysteine S-methyltransferase family protein [Pseudomonadota bacterium]